MAIDPSPSRRAIAGDLPPDENVVPTYRAIAPAAIASLVLGLASILTFLWPYFAALGALAILRLGVFAFKTDEAAFGRTREGLIHLVFAVLTFTLAYEVVSLGGSTALEITAGPVNTAFAVLGWIVPVSLALVVVTMLPRLRAFFGLAERVFLVSTLLWFGLLAARLFAGP